jgi:hypothetical protein
VTQLPLHTGIAAVVLLVLFHRALASILILGFLHRGDFLALWKDADPETPILKQAKAEYAKLQ